MNGEIYEFVAEARRYCALIESGEVAEPTAFAKECLATLLRLYHQLLLLPSTDPDEPELPERTPAEDWKALWERTAQRIKRDRYWEVFEPFAEQKPDPIYASISDDLTDVWNDVKKGLSILDSGKPNCIEDAVWNRRFLFGSHWGHHAAGAIGALTALVAGEFIDDGGGASSSTAS